MSVPLICINPIEDPQKEYWSFMTDEIADEFDEIEHDRLIQSQYSVCILTNDEYALHLHGEEFKDNHLFISNEKVTDDEFWSGDEIKKAIEIIIEECL